MEFNRISDNMKRFSFYFKRVAQFSLLLIFFSGCCNCEGKKEGADCAVKGAPLPPPPPPPPPPAPPISSLPLIRASIDALSMRPVEGGLWNGQGTVVIGPRGLEITLGVLHREPKVEVSADNNDDYAVKFFNHDSELGEAIAVQVAGIGLRTRLLLVPERAQREGFDRVRIIPVRGDNRYSIGYFGFVPDPPTQQAAVRAAEAASVGK